ncbi:unnamed protein product [Thelazia callipaeda]|uniref:Innexin n=1 Tax=Thelazia callipaeda TaxID=103827 RepID=A0A0N5D9Q1_THECL|nr:unnamed protein product [Thelazia callipaeda]
MSVEALLKSLKTFATSPNEDYTDRLHSCITVNLLITLSIITAWKVFNGDPIHCMLSSPLPNSWLAMYANNSDKKKNDNNIITVMITMIDKCEAIVNKYIRDIVEQGFWTSIKVTFGKLEYK